MNDLFNGLPAWIEQYRWLDSSIAFILLLLISAFTYWMAKKVVVVGLRHIIGKLPKVNKSIFENHSVIRPIANIVPGLVLLNGIQSVPHLPAGLTQFVEMCAQTWIFITIARAISEVLNIFNLFYQRTPRASNKPIKGYLQLIKLILFVVCALMILGTFLKKDIFTLFAGFGAMAAVLMLVFQNTILSLVASVQISSYDMIRIGDWIEMNSLGADGEVTDISLHTVTVQNWDKTFTTIPTNRLVTDTFKNWRGMADAGARRIKRAIYLDQNKISFLNNDDLERLKKSSLLQGYLDKKIIEVQQWNQSVAGLLNQQHLTNIGTFRVYVQHYLQQHAEINQKETVLVRQLQPTAEGLPLEIYCFTKVTGMSAYENVQSDIFDHLYAILDEFGLQAYQAPSGADYREARPV